jgi:membrane protein implicated in regulation of membrane protease activity
MRRLLIVLGIVLVLAGLLWPVLTRLGLGRLPGDIVVHRGNVSFYFPIVSCLVVSVVLSLLLWLINR